MREEHEEKTNEAPTTANGSSASDAPAAGSVPSADALHKLVALVHQAGVLLASPSEVADSINWMEVQLAPSATSGPSTSTLWVLRIHDLLLCFPTPVGSVDGTATTMTSLLASLRPFLACLAVHYACVSTIHERNYRTLQKNMEKQAASKAK